MQDTGKLYGGIYGEFQLTPEAAQEYAEVVSRDGHTTPEAVHAAAERLWQHRETYGPDPRQAPTYTSIEEVVTATLGRR